MRNETCEWNGASWATWNVRTTYVTPPLAVVRGSFKIASLYGGRPPNTKNKGATIHHGSDGPDDSSGRGP